MKAKEWSILILIMCLIGFSAGFYLKFIKSYTDEIVKTEARSLISDKTQRQLRLGETIAFLKEMEELTNNYNIENKQNKVALKKLQCINQISIIMMVTSIILIISTSHRLISQSRA